MKIVFMCVRDCVCVLARIRKCGWMCNGTVKKNGKNITKVYISSLEKNYVIDFNLCLFSYENECFDEI